MFKKKPKHTQAHRPFPIYTPQVKSDVHEKPHLRVFALPDVPIARIGTLMYGDGEVPVTAGQYRIILIQRGEDDYFDPKPLQF